VEKILSSTCKNERAEREEERALTLAAYALSLSYHLCSPIPEREEPRDRVKEGEGEIEGGRKIGTVLHVV